MVKLDNAEADSDTNKPVYSDVAIALMAKLGYVPSRGLGKHSDGIKEPIPVIERPKRLGLGYVLAEDDDMPVPALPPLAPAPQMPLVPPNKDIAEAALEPSNDDGRDIVAEAAEVWKEYVATVPGRDSWGPDSLREETPALMFKRFKEARERLHNKKHLEPKEEPKEEKIAKSSYPEDVLINNHTKVWGSYWENNRWGYRCCKSFSKESFCPESPAPQCPEPPAPQRKQSRKSRRNKKKQVSSEKKLIKVLHGV